MSKYCLVEAVQVWYSLVGDDKRNCEQGYMKVPIGFCCTWSSALVLLICAIHVVRRSRLLLVCTDDCPVCDMHQKLCNLWFCCGADGDHIDFFLVDRISYEVLRMM